MRRAGLLLFLLLSPTGAFAAQGGPGLAGTLVQTVSALALVIGLILVLYYLAGRLMRVPRGRGLGYIRVVETRHLAPKKSLLLVEVGGEYLLLSNGAEGVGFIKRIDMLGEIEVVEEVGEVLLPAALRRRLAAFAEEVPAGFARRLSGLKKSGGVA